MADVKISELTAKGSAVSTNDLFETSVSGTATNSVTGQNFVDLVGADNLASIVSEATARSNIGAQTQSTVLDNTTASFTTADETKLDGIEAGADITDATNVTAAGALMLSIDNIVATNKKVQFRDTGIYINSSVDGTLNLVADTEVQITSPYIDLATASLNVDGTIASGAITSTAALKVSGTAATVTSGTGTPEGSKTAAIGSVFMRTDGTTDTSLYRKETGTGSTGWVAVTAGTPGGNETLAQTLALGNTSGANDLLMASGQKVTTNTIDETTATSGVTIDGVLAKDSTVKAGTLTIGAGSVTDSSGAITFGNENLTTTGNVDANGVEFDSLSGTGAVAVTDILDEDNMASNSATKLATQQSIKAYVDASSGGGGDITAVIAGTGISGGGTSGDVTITNSSPNATHTGDVTGATELTIASGAVETGMIADDAVTADKLANSINSAIAANTAKTGITSGQASAIVANTAKTGITSGQASEITANTAKTGITSGQASEITANTAKTGITSGQASAITANTAKVTNATHSGEVTGATALTITDNVVDEANLKVSNTPTNGYVLTAQSGNTGGLTWAEAAAGGYASSTSAPSSPVNGDRWFESTNGILYIYIDSNWVDISTAAAGGGGAGDITGVTAGTGISGGGTSGTVTITNSSPNATHTGEVTGATALTIADNIVDEANLKVSNAPTNGYFLSAQSGNTGGLTWAAAGGGGGGGGSYDLISTITASGQSSFEWTSLSGYDTYYLLVTNLKSNNNNTSEISGYITVSGDGTNYSSANGKQVGLGRTQTSNAYWNMTNNRTPQGNVITQHEATIYNSSDTTTGVSIMAKTLYRTALQVQNNATDLTFITAAFHETTSSGFVSGIQKLKFQFYSGVVSSGEFSLYGVTRS